MQDNKRRRTDEARPLLVSTPVTSMLLNCYGVVTADKSATYMHAWALFLDTGLIHPDAPLKAYWDIYLAALVLYSVSHSRKTEGSYAASNPCLSHPKFMIE